MRIRVMLLGVVCALALSVPGLGWAKNKKVTICHKGKEITVSENAVKAHLGHGDYRGRCRDAAPSPEPVRTTRSYVYYPDIRVYFDQVSKRYFFPVGDGWESAPRLPDQFHIDGARTVKIQLDTEQPWRFHSKVLKQYPVVQTEFRFSYFPNLFLYLSADGTRSYRFVDGVWKAFEGVPSSVKIEGAKRVSVTVDQEKPFLHHDRFVVEYPPDDDVAVVQSAICHKGKKTLHLPASAVEAHLNHGDTLGKCAGGGQHGGGKGGKKHGKGKK